MILRRDAKSIVQRFGCLECQALHHVTGSPTTVYRFFVTELSNLLDLSQSQDVVKVIKSLVD